MRLLAKHRRMSRRIDPDLDSEAIRDRLILLEDRSIGWSGPSAACPGLALEVSTGARRLCPLRRNFMERLLGNVREIGVAGAKRSVPRTTLGRRCRPPPGHDDFAPATQPTRCHTKTRFRIATQWPAPCHAAFRIMRWGRRRRVTWPRAEGQGSRLMSVQRRAKRIHRWWIGLVVVAIVGIGGTALFAVRVRRDGQGQAQARGEADEAMAAIERAAGAGRWEEFEERLGHGSTIILGMGRRCCCAVAS